MTDKVKEIPEYKKLLELHKKYHKVLWEGDYDNRPYFDKYKLFGYHLKHPEEDIENYEETIKYIEKYFEAYELPLYTISTLLEEYNSGIEKAKKNDEFGINGEVTNYRNSWNKKVVRVKGKIQNIQKTYNDARDMYDNELLQWEITVSSDDFLVMECIFILIILLKAHLD